MRKIILLLIFGILLIGGVNSQMEWDNVADYENNDMTVIITNWLGLGDTLGKAKLQDRSSVDEVLYVMPNGYRNVLEYKLFDWADLYKDGIGDFEITCDGKKDKRSYNYKEVYYVDIPKYIQVCEEIKNMNKYGDGRYCYQIEDGTKKEKRYKDLTSKDIPKEGIEIAVFTYIKTGDYCDGVLTLAGKQITRHAFWVDSLTGIKAGWNFNTTITSTATDVATGFNNLTNFGGVEWINDDCIIGSCANFTNSNYLMIGNTDFDINENNDFTVLFWGKREIQGSSNDGLFSSGANVNYEFITLGIGTSDGNNNLIFSTDGASWGINDNIATEFWADGSWKLVTFRRTGTNFSIAINSTVKYSNTKAGTIHLGGVKNISLGIDMDSYPTGGFLDGGLDEYYIWNRSLSSVEVIDYYNLGSPLAFGDEGDTSPTITLNYPNNGANFTTTSIGINCSAIDDSVVVNITMYLDGVAETVETGIANYLEWNNTITATTGNHNWTCLASDDTNNDAWATANKTFTVEAGVTIIQSAPVNFFNTTNNVATIKFNVTSIGAEDLDEASVYIYDSGGTLDFTNSIASLGTKSENLTFSSLGLDDGIYLWNASINGSLGNTAKTSFWNFTIDTSSPLLSIIYPENTTYNINITSLNYTYFDLLPGRCLYSTNNWATNSTPISCGSANFTSVPSVEGSNTFRIFGNDTLGNWNTSSVTFFQDSLTPLIDYDATTKSDGYNSTVNWIYAGVSVTETNEKNITFLLWNITEEVDRTSYFTAVRNINWTTLPDTNYTYNVTVCDNFNLCNTTLTRGLVIGTTAPTIIEYTPLGSLGFQTTLPFNISLNFTASQTLLQSCWYNSTFNLSITSIVCNSRNNVSIISPQNQTIYVYANTTFGLETMRSLEFYPDIVELSQHYITPTFEGAVERFRINVSIIDWSSITTAYINYNNTYYLGTIENIAGNNFSIYRDLSIPLVTEITNRTFWWNITLDSNINGLSSKNNQSVLELSIDGCGTNTDVFYNFTIRDEKNQTIINESIHNTFSRINIQIYPLTLSILIAEYNSSFTTNPFAVCLNNNFSTGESYRFDLQVQYAADLFSSELYHVQNETINLTSFPTEISLYDLILTDAQVFKIIFRDSSFLPVENALIKIYRKYIDEGIFRIVEIPKTDERGETVASFVVNDVIYNIVVEKFGVILETFNNVITSCQTPAITTCEIDLNAFADSVTLPDFLEEGDFQFTLDHNKTSNVVISVFSIPSGTVSTIRLEVIREDVLGTAVCSDTILASSGTLSCIIPNSFGNSSVRASLYQDDVLKAWGDLSVRSSPRTIYGTSVVILALFVFLTLLGAGVSDNPIYTIIFFMVGVILLFAMNLVASNGFIGATATILFLIIAIIIVIIKGSRRN